MCNFLWLFGSSLPEARHSKRWQQRTLEITRPHSLHRLLPSAQVIHVFQVWNAVRFVNLCQMDEWRAVSAWSAVILVPWCIKPRRNTHRPHVEVREVIWLNFFFFFSFHRWPQQQRPTGRRRLQTKTLTICLRSSSLEIAVWAKPPFCSATLMTPSHQPLSVRWASISRWKPSTGMTRGSNYRSG